MNAKELRSAIDKLRKQIAELKTPYLEDKEKFLKSIRAILWDAKLWLFAKPDIPTTELNVEQLEQLKNHLEKQLAYQIDDINSTFYIELDEPTQASRNVTAFIHSIRISDEP